MTAAQEQPKARLSRELREFRRARGLDHKEIADAAGVRERTIRRALQGHIVLAEEPVRLICARWGVEPEEWLVLRRRAAEEERNRNGGPGGQLVPVPPALPPDRPPVPPPVSPTPPRPRRRLRRTVRIAFAVVAVLAVLVVVVVALVSSSSPPLAGTVTPTPERCGDTSVVTTLREVRECVGLVTRTDTMPMALRPVLDKIGAENASVAGQQTVALAYMLPIPGTIDPAPGGGAPETVAQFAAELDGVLRAQRRANETLTLGDQPKVRVVVYSTGRDGAQWVRVLNDLEGRRAAENIVAVAGLGAGLESTGALAKALTDQGVPVFPSRATADQLTTGTDPLGLFRTTATSDQLAPVAAATLRSEGVRRLQTVQDVRADNLDAASLAQDFAAAFAAGPVAPATITYDSSLDSAGTTFSNELAARCGGGRPAPAPPDAFFVAGRGPQIAEFLISLNTSPCPGPVTVLAGPDGAEVLEQLRQARHDPTADSQQRELVTAFDNPKFRFRYLGAAHPDQWTQSAFDGRYIDTIASFDDLRGFPADRQLQGGDQLVGYDATLAAITCARRVVNQYTQVVTPLATRDACTTVTAAGPVYGAAGPIRFDARGHTTPGAIPVVEIRADGAAVLLPP